MAFIDVIILALLFVFMIILMLLVRKNNRLMEENERLNEQLEQVIKPIIEEEILPKPKIEVKKPKGNTSLSDQVIEAIDAGESKEAIARRLNTPLSKIELIIKFDRLKKRNES